MRLPWVGPQPDPVLRARLLRELPMLSRGDRLLLQRLLAGEELEGMAEADGIPYITVYMRYRHLLKTLKTRLRPAPQWPAGQGCPTAPSSRKHPA